MASRMTVTRGAVPVFREGYPWGRIAMEFPLSPHIAQTAVYPEVQVDIGMYERLPEPTSERLHFSPADEEAFIRRWGSLPLSPKLTVQDAYDSRVQSGLVSLEEGVVSN